MIAFTNHALDHLLSSVLDIGITKIVRLGSRSSDERVSQYSIENLEQTADAQFGLRASLNVLYRDLKKIEGRINLLMKKVHQTTPTSEEILEYLDLHYPEHHEQMHHPPKWIHDLRSQYQSLERGWRTVGSHGKEEEPDLSPYTFWCNARDIEFLQRVQTEAEAALIIQSSRHPTLATKNRYIIPLEDMGDESDSSEGDEGDVEPWEAEAWGRSESLPASSHSVSDPLHSPSMNTEETNQPTDQLAQYFSKYDMCPPTVPTTDRNIDDIFDSPTSWSLSKQERRRLHHHWAETVRRDAYEIYQEEFKDLSEKHQSAQRQYNEAKDELWRELLTKTDVIGCTTTGAAKLISLLKGVSPRVMLVEEAGQVLEAHILGSLVPSVDHLILIGDPLQLRPTLNNYCEQT
jgi:hypothetical protein